MQKAIHSLGILLILALLIPYANSFEESRNALRSENSKEGSKFLSKILPRISYNSVKTIVTKTMKD